MMRLACLLGLVLVACSGSDATIGDGGSEKDGAITPSDGGGGSDAKVDTGVMDSGPSCTGECVPTPPMGWSFTSYDDKNRNPCPSDFGKSSDLVEDPTGGDAKCGCTCGVQTNPSCDVQQPVLVFATNAQCNNGSTIANLSGNSCSTQTVSFSANGPVYAYGKAQVSIKGGACGMPQTTKSIPPSSVYSGRACGLTAQRSACDKSKTCVPKAQGPLCVEREGDHACPAEWPNKHLAGSAVEDTRDCSACTCSLQGKCADPVAELYGQASCSGNPTSVTLNGSCAQVGAGAVTFLSNQVKSSPSGTTCNASGANPIGELGVKDARTICCR